MIIYYINVLAFFNHISELITNKYSQVKIRLTKFIISHASLRYGLPLWSYFFWFFRWLKSNNIRELNELSAMNYELLLARKGKRKLYSSLWRRNQILEMATYYEHPQVLLQLETIAKELEQVVQQIEQRGHIPLLSPLHICSDMVATLVCTMIAPAKTSIISIYQQGYFGPDENGFLSKRGLQLNQINPLDASSKLIRVLKRVRARQENIVIFADALPQCNWRIIHEQMPTKTLKIFGRQGRLHSGIDRIATMLNAEVIFFYIFWENGNIRLRTFPSVFHEELADNVGEIIETAITERPEDWILWHIPNQFYFNSTC